MWAVLTALFEHLITTKLTSIIYLFYFFFNEGCAYVNNKVANVNAASHKACVCFKK